MRKIIGLVGLVVSLSWLVLFAIVYGEAIITAVENIGSESPQIGFALLLTTTNSLFLPLIALVLSVMCFRQSSLSIIKD